MINLLNCKIDELDKLSKSKRIFGYGVSKKLDTRSLYRTPDYPLSNIIYKLVDSDINKCKKKFKFNDGNEKEIIDYNQFRRELDSQNDIVLIISMKYGEIIEQLDNDELLNGTDCFVLDFIDDYFDSCIDEEIYKNSLSKTFLIPNTIHYCWFGNNDLPEIYKKYINSWRHFCPDYDIIKWSEENYDVNKHPYTKWAYENKKWAFVSDYARIDILYNYGGIYLDTDVELIKNLDELRRFPAFMGYESKQMINSGLGMGSKKDNPILLDFLQDYDACIVSEGCFDMIPCTVHQSKVLEKYGLKRNNTFQVLDKENMIVLPTEFLCGIRMNTHVRQITSNTFALHHYAGNWGGDEIKKEKDKNREKYKNLLERVQPRLEY